MNDTFLTRLDRVRGPLANGYMTPQDAFLAVKGAVVLNRSQA